jgi:hypothetical protein
VAGCWATLALILAADTSPVRPQASR